MEEVTESIPTWALRTTRTWDSSQRKKNYSLKMAVFWVVSPCSLVDTDRRFTGTYYLHNQAPLKRRSIHTRLHGATSHKAAIWVLDAVRIRDLTINSAYRTACKAWISEWKISSAVKRLDLYCGCTHISTDRPIYRVTWQRSSLSYCLSVRENSCTVGTHHTGQHESIPDICSANRASE
jgi:hypothetical protein